VHFKNVRGLKFFVKVFSKPGGLGDFRLPECLTKKHMKVWVIPWSERPFLLNNSLFRWFLYFFRCYELFKIKFPGSQKRVEWEVFNIQYKLHYLTQQIIHRILSFKRTSNTLMSLYELSSGNSVKEWEGEGGTPLYKLDISRFTPK